jgi:hypothetical protein
VTVDKVFVERAQRPSSRLRLVPKARSSSPLLNRATSSSHHDSIARFRPLAGSERKHIDNAAAPVRHCQQTAVARAVELAEQQT